MNLVTAAVKGRTVAFGGFELPIDGAIDLSAYDRNEVILGIRPSDLEDHGVWQNAALPTIEVKADVTEELGSELNVIFTIDAPPVQTDAIVAASSDEGEDLLMLEGGCQFCARVDARSKAKPGSSVTLSTDPARFHFFDPASGAAIDARSAVSAGA
jgi:multiple sugar transport system ATP-binding protein